MAATLTALSAQNVVRVEGLTRDEVAVKFHGKVMLLARRIYNRLPQDAAVDLDDLLSIGHMGLLEAFDRFEGDRGIRFSTFAEYRIRGAIYDALRDADTLSRRTRQLAQRVERARAAVTDATGDAPSAAQVARQMGVSVEAYHDAVQATATVHLLSFDAPSDATDDAPSFADRLVDEAAERPDASVATDELRDLLHDAIASLPDRQRQCVLLYYAEDLSLAEIGSVFGVSVSRVSQILSDARGRLRTQLSERLSSADLDLDLV